DWWRGGAGKLGEDRGWGRKEQVSEQKSNQNAREAGLHVVLPELLAKVQDWNPDRLVVVETASLGRVRQGARPENAGTRPSASPNGRHNDTRTKWWMHIFSRIAGNRTGSIQ